MIDCGNYREPYVIQAGDTGEIIEARLGLPRGSLAYAPRFDAQGNPTNAPWAVGQTICVPNALSIEMTNEHLISEPSIVEPEVTSQGEPQSDVTSQADLELETTSQSTSEYETSSNSTVVSARLDAVPSLWAMVSVDELYRFLWVTEWGLDLSLYSYEQAELLFAGEFVDDFVDQTDYGIAPPPPGQLPNISASTATMEAEVYLEYLWRDVWGLTEPYDFEQAQERFIIIYGYPVSDLSYVTNADDLIVSPEMQAILDNPFAQVLLGSGGNVDQTLLANLINEYGMDAFLEFYDLVISFGFVAQPADSSDYSQAYDYLRAVEEGEEPPFVPWFDPDSTTDDALYGSGTLFSYGENGNTDEAVAAWMLGRVAQMLALMPEFDGVSIEDIETQVSMMLPVDATPEQIASFANDIAFEISNLYANNLDPDVSYYEANQIAQGLLTDSAIFLQYRQIDEARQIVQAWDYETATNTLNALRGTVASIQALPATILTVPTDGAKAEFVSLLTGLEAWYNQMDAFRQQIPLIENEALLSREMMDEQLALGQNLFWMSMGLTVGALFEPADWVISFFEYLATGDPSILLLAAIPLVPGAVARAGRVARSLPDVASGIWRFLGDLDYRSITSGGVPPDFFSQLFGYLGSYFDELIQGGGRVIVGRYTYDENFWERVARFDPDKPHEARTAARLEQELGITLEYNPNQDYILIGGTELPNGNRVRGQRRYLTGADFYYVNYATGEFRAFDAVTFAGDRPNLTLSDYLNAVEIHLTTKTNITIVIDVEELRIQGRLLDIQAVYNLVDEIVRDGRLAQGTDYVFIPPRQ